MKFENIYMIFYSGKIEFVWNVVKYTNFPPKSSKTLQCTSSWMVLGKDNINWFLQIRKSKQNIQNCYKVCVLSLRMMLKIT